MTIRPVLALALALIVTGCSPKPPQPKTETPVEPQTSARQATRSDHRRAPETTSTPGNFDFYLLNLSWSPEYCATHSTAPECAQHRALTLHGLWPQNNDGTFPEACSSVPGPANPAQYADIYPDPGLLRHEWQTHGTCSGLAPDAFLQLARRASKILATPTALTSLTRQTSLPPATILGDFASSNPQLPNGSLALTCGSNFLTAVELCLDKNLKPIACPNVRSCAANTVRIPPVTQ